MILTWENFRTSQLNQQHQQEYIVINLLFIVVVFWDYKICYGMWKADTISVIANIEGAVDFICGDGQSFYQVKSIKKKPMF